MNESEIEFMQRAIALAQLAMNSGEGGPFGAVVVRDGKIVGESGNKIKKHNDPTAHAEIEAIRNACKQLSTTSLEDCVLYTSCEPCPMCVSAIYFAKLGKVFYACTREDSAAAGFDNRYIYEELALNNKDRKIEMKNGLRAESFKVFEEWMVKRG